MTSRFLESCTREFAAQAEWLFDHAPRIPGTGMATIPVVGSHYLLGMPVPDCLYQRVCGALCSRERFGQDEPDLPPLPLHERDIEVMKYDDNPLHALVGHYADSLSLEQWDYELHPRLPAFASGLLACEYAPIEIRSDYGLQQKYPPRPLDGMSNEFVWCSPATLAQDRKLRAMIAAAGISL